MSELRFRLNHQDCPLAGVAPTESLLRWLRGRGLTGTKEGCGDGDCGACTVVLVERSAAEEGEAVYRAVNACLLPMGVLAGREVLTVEALAEGGELHPVQRAMVEHAGSQCGYCTPGFVMSLFAGYYDGQLDDATIEGNLCRCTGYLPIRRAAADLAKQAREPDRFDRLLKEQPATAASEGALVGQDVDGGVVGIHNPQSLEQALALKADHPQARWIAGATDLGVDLSRGRPLAPVLIALDRIDELRDLQVDASMVRIGAGLPLRELELRIAGVFPALDQMLHVFAARQIRNRATLGGNLGSASPIGDLLPWLLASDAWLEIAGVHGRRELAVSDFFTGYRRTRLAADELVVAIRVPRGAARQAAYKVAKRPTDDISIVAAVYALALDSAGAVSHARLAYGGVAATPLRALTVEQWLLGRRLDAATVEEAAQRLRAAFTAIDDQRASAAYRRELCGSLFLRYVAEHWPEVDDGNDGDGR